MTSRVAIREFRGEYGFLSNFYVDTDGKTAEHLFQLNKATNDKDRTYVLRAKSPREAKRRGREIQLRSDWDRVKDQIMLDIIRMKFIHNKILADMLLDTYPLELIEGNTWGDTYWGIDLHTGEGENKLGKILMQVRDELRAAQCR